MKHISVAVSWAIYEVPDETFEMLNREAYTTPPHVVLEVMAMNGQAKKVGTVGTITVPAGYDEEEEDEDGLPEDGGSIFDEDTEDDED